jgi:hypothetical protein
LSAVVGRVQGGVSLEEYVEACAEGLVIAVFGTLLHIVGLESLETQVCVGRDRYVEVFECCNVSGWSLSFLSFLVELWVGFEGISSVRFNMWTVTIWSEDRIMLGHSTKRDGMKKKGAYCGAQGSSGLMNPQYVPASGVVAQAVSLLVVEVDVYIWDVVLVAVFQLSSEEEVQGGD